MGTPRSGLWSRYLDALGANGRPPGWRPSPLLLVATILVALLIGSEFVREALSERGVATAVLAVVVVALLAAPVIWPGGRQPFAEAHPWLDGALAFPIGLLAALLLTGWSTTACLVTAALFTVLVLAIRLARLWRERHPHAPDHDPEPLTRLQLLGTGVTAAAGVGALNLARGRDVDPVGLGVLIVGVPVGAVLGRRVYLWRMRRRRERPTPRRRNVS